MEAETGEKDDQSISVAQGYNSQSIAVAYPAEDSVHDYDGEAKVEVAAEPERDYLPPSSEYLPPAVFNEVSNEENSYFSKTEDAVEETVADEVIPVAIADSKITVDSSAEEVRTAEVEGKPVYGVPVETREPKQIVEEGAPADEIPEVKNVEEEVVVKDTKTVIENEELPVDDAKTVADESVLVAEEPTPVVKDIPEPVATTKRTRVFPSRRPSFVPQRKKVSVQLKEEDEEALEYVPVRNRQVAKPKKEIVEEEEEQPFPLGGTFFPINFGGTSGGAIAIANSFSTSRGGSSKSQAVAYGSGNDAPAARKPVKSQLPADCDC